MTRHLLHLFVFVMILVGAAGPVWAAEPRIIIRDAEIETALKSWTRPIILAAGLDPDVVKIILVQSPDINAFVAGGQNIFIYTGLIDKSENAGEVVGVIAHELGHIAGGHLIRTRDQMENASYEAMVGTILGLGAAIVTGTPEAAAAISTGAASIAQSGFLAFSRGQEASADQAGLRFMKTAQINPTGLMTFMQKLADQEILPSSQQSAFARSHPLSRDRVETLQAGVDATPLKDKPLPSIWAGQHARMKAKLSAFINPQQVEWVYPANDHSIAADYARAIAAYRTNHVDDALTRADGLIDREPQNPYFYELKGQMLYDFGKVDRAVAAYARAVDVAPAQPLIKLSYAQAIMEQHGAGGYALRQVATLLEQVRLQEPRNTRVFRQLGIAYGRMGQSGMAQAMLAEESFLQGRYRDARAQANAALIKLPATARERQRVKDLMADLDRVTKDKKSGDNGDE
jgi:predicted Zn-dependent protease